MDRRALAAAVFLVALGASRPAAAQDRQAIEEAAQKARAAHDAHEVRAFLQWSQKLVALAPRSTRALYNLAVAHALNGDAPAAATILERLTKMGVANDAAKDADFEAVRSAPSVQAALEHAKSLEGRVGSSEVAFTLPEKDLITEGVAYDPKSRAFFVSSVRKRKVVRRAADGKVSDFTKPADGLLSAVGLAVDAGRRRLWVTTEGFPQMEGFKKEDEGRSFLVEYDLDGARLLRRIPPPAGVEHAELSDLAVDLFGNVFVADPNRGRIYVLRPGAEALTVLTDAGTIGSAQGIAPSLDGRFVFVADYVQGIVRVDAKTGAAVLLPVPEDAAATGIDGLVLHGDALIGIQNGVRPHRILRLGLDHARERITAVETLERNHPAFDEPTLGTLAEGAFYYIANSQYGKVKDEGSLAADVRPPVILRLRLDR